MVLLLALAVAFGAAPPPPATDDNAPGEAIARPDAAEMVADAKQLYVGGGHTEAVEILIEVRRRVMLGDAVEPEVALEALAYLGEIYYILGQFDQARVTFREMLELDPDYTLSPLEHPIAIVGAVQQLRSQLSPPEDVAPSGPAAARSGPRLPWWGYAPFGVPQLAQQRPARGVAYATLQTGFAISSVAFMAHLRSVNGTVGEPIPHSADSYDELYGQIQVERFVGQWSTNAAFYLTWLASHLDGRHTWRDTRWVAPSVGPVTVGTSESGRVVLSPTLGVHGQF